MTLSRWRRRRRRQRQSCGAAAASSGVRRAHALFSQEKNTTQTFFFSSVCHSSVAIFFCILMHCTHLCIKLKIIKTMLRHTHTYYFRDDRNATKAIKKELVKKLCVTNTQQYVCFCDIIIFFFLISNACVCETLPNNVYVHHTYFDDQ